MGGYRIRPYEIQCFEFNLRNKTITNYAFLIPNSSENALQRGTGDPSPTLNFPYFFIDS